MKSRRFKGTYAMKTPESIVLADCLRYLKIRGFGGLALVVKSWEELDRELREEGFVNDGPLFEALPYGGA